MTHLWSIRYCGCRVIKLLITAEDVGEWPSVKVCCNCRYNLCCANVNPGVVAVMVGICANCCKKACKSLSRLSVLSIAAAVAAVAMWQCVEVLELEITSTPSVKKMDKGEFMKWRLNSQLRVEIWLKVKPGQHLQVIVIKVGDVQPTWGLISITNVTVHVEIMNSIFTGWQSIVIGESRCWNICSKKASLPFICIHQLNRCKTFNLHLNRNNYKEKDASTPATCK